MRIGETNSLARQAVEIRRRDFRLRIEAADIAIAEVIGENEDDVWRGRTFCGQRRSVNEHESGKELPKNEQARARYQHRNHQEQEVTEETEGLNSSKQSNRSLRERNANRCWRQVLPA